MGEPKVSVIIPIYMTEHYLRECIDSVVGQSYWNLEIILVDNGSPDNCGTICDDYAAKDSRILVIHRSNGGPSSSRNAGLAAASGVFISFVDSDDIISPVFIESLLSAKADIAQCGYTSDINKLKAHAAAKFEYMDGLRMSEKLCTEGSLTNSVVWSKLWKKECFDGLRFPEGRIHEDEFITWKTFWRAKRVACCTAPLYYYRRRAGSLMNSDLSEHSTDDVDALRERFSFYESSGAERLADFSKAVFCYTLREKWRNLAHVVTPEQADSLSRELRQVYKDVMRSKELDMRKKVAVTLHMMSPSVYSAVKTLTGG